MYVLMIIQQVVILQLGQKLDSYTCMHGNGCIKQGDDCLKHKLGNFKFYKQYTITINSCHKLYTNNIVHIFINIWEI